MRLKNISKRMVIVTFPHEEVCGEECYCTPTNHLQTAHNPQTGDRGVRQLSLMVPKSLHIPAGTETEDLPEVLANSALSNQTLRGVA